MTAYYNENDPFMAGWLRELITHGFIAPGDVDERSIEDVAPNDIRGYRQAHFFAGIGGWSYALRLAGWPDDRPVWTGSCPCQPFSTAGKGIGFADQRHLWPSWSWLIRQCHPSIIFGEQVAAAVDWLDLVQGDLEKEDYSVGPTIIGAHSVGAPHIRQRLYWVANRCSPGLEVECQQQAWRQREAAERSGEACELGNPSSTGSGRYPRIIPGAQSIAQGEVWGKSYQSQSANFWADVDWIECKDYKRRPIEPGTFPLANGIPGRVGLLRGYGNAIVPWLAAEFIKAAIDAVESVSQYTVPTRLVSWE